MRRSVKKLVANGKLDSIDERYDNLVEMLESGLKDQEIASELGMSSNELARLKREIMKDFL
jgi:DNA-binding NarL/FixJ family response regulator